MNILIVSSEVYPFAKTGGLADVTGSLPLYLKKMGHTVSVIMPYYRVIKDSGYVCEKVLSHVSVPIGPRLKSASVYKTLLNNNIPVYLIDKKEYYDRPDLYGARHGAYSDNSERFIYFSHSLFEILPKLPLKPDVIHCNDWHTGLVPVYLKILYQKDPFFKDVKTIFTIHNLAYQGVFWKQDLSLTNLGWELFTVDGIEFYDGISLLKGGLNFADIITTVSKTYSKEIQTPQFGERLEGLLKRRSKNLFGIVNGIDYKEWNPVTDPYIVKNYSITDLKGKKECKSDLLSAFSLKEDRDVPVLGIISRLVEQKGIDILCESLEDILILGFRVVILGVGDEKYHKKLVTIQDKHKNNISSIFRFDNSLAHKIEAGSDMFLMPSLYEPCGLNQMYSLRYGTIPIVTATGGLNDTVINFIRKTGKGNGFKFNSHTKKDLLATIKKALLFYKEKPLWKKIMKNAMNEDNSWEHSAKEYEKLYKRALRL